MLEGGASSTALGNKTQYTTMVRFAYTQNRASEFCLKILRRFNWTRIAVIWSGEKAFWKVMASTIDYLRLQPGISAESITYYPFRNGPSEYKRVVQDAHLKARSESAYFKFCSLAQSHVKLICFS